MTHDGLILVTGASGKTGRRCLAHLVTRGARVRALVRRENAARELLAAGAAEAIVGDMFAPDYVARACEGAQQILHICPPMHPQEEKLAQMMIAQATAAGAARFVLWSVLHPHINVPHHRRKQQAEAALIDSGLSFTILQPGRYMQHLETIWSVVRERGVHAFPFSIASRFSLAHLDDLAAACAQVLTEEGHENATYELAGPEALSQQDCAAIIARVLGRSVTAQVAPLEDTLEKGRAAGLPEWRIETLRSMNIHYAAHGLAGNSNILRWLLGREPKTFSDYVVEMIRG
jgi:uncharacterized protein YbjT (DUF2867 family)